MMILVEPDGRPYPRQNALPPTSRPVGKEDGEQTYGAWLPDVRRVMAFWEAGKIPAGTKNHDGDRHRAILSVYWQLMS